MVKGIHLTLLIGPGVPVPAPQVVLDALESVQVTRGTDRSGFQLTFTTGKTSSLLTTMLPAGYFDPIITRIVVMVTVHGLPHVLMDGIVTRQEITPSSDPGQSKITITGEDLSILMDLVEMPFMRYPAMPEIAQLYAILAKYAAFGIAPMVLPPVIPSLRVPTEGYDTHTGTDLQYIRQHAQRCGYVFYVEPGPLPLTNIAYFGPDVRIPIPQPALNVNMDAHTNVESMNFTFDGLKSTLPIVMIHNQETKVPIPIPIPDITPLSPPLGLIPPIPKNFEIINESAKYSPVQAALIGLAKAAKTSDAVTAKGSLDVTRYGRTLKPRRLVGLRGVGTAFDGLYFVKSVTHTLRRGEYKQSFTLVRNGLISTLAKVPA